MCGIVGYIGNREVTSILVNGLKKLEYRGYDSAGVAILTEGKLEVIKAKGRLQMLEERVATYNLKGSMGIGHTRWATHGEPSDLNSHPHTSKSGEIAVVHNGIIENYMKLKEFLLAKGYKFVSETDTEVVAHLLDYYYKGDIFEAVIEVLHRVEGAYALGVVCKNNPDEIIAVRKDSPLVIGLGEGENFIASDIPALLEHTRKVYLLNDNEIVVLKREGVKVFNIDREEIKKEIFEVNWDVSSAEKAGYPHFMIKEICDQPKALRDTIKPRVRDGRVILDKINITKEELENFSRIFIIACGTAYHAGIVGKYWIEKFTRKPVEVDIASEFRYRNPIIDDKSLVIIISQSGETLDTMAALREAKKRGARIVSVVNVVGSSIARESDDVLYTWAGPEISVCSTKTYTTQLSAMCLIAINFACKLGAISESDTASLLDDLANLPAMVEKLLGDKECVQFFASRHYNAKDIFFIGRGLDYAVALEGSLKLKEISYIHSEAYAAGELKHGTIALIEQGTLVVALCTQEMLFEKMLSNIKEVKARGAVVLGLAMEGHAEVEKVSDYVLYIPKINPVLAPILTVIPLQMFAYYVACEKGCDVDKPRNLAKSVTVE